MMEFNEKFRCHASIIVEKVFQLFWVILIFMAGIFGDFLEEDAQYSPRDIVLACIVAAAVILIPFIYNVLVWRKTWIYIDENAIVMEKNTINKKKITIAMVNVANVNIERNMFQTLIGTCKVKIETNSVTTDTNADMEIVLNVERASALQAKVMSYISEDSHEPVNIEAEEYNHRDDGAGNKEILKHCICTLNVWVIVFVVACVGAIIFFTSQGMEWADNEDSGSGGGIAGIISTIVLAVGAIYSVLNSFLVYYKFMAYREGDRIHISYGFFHKKTHNISVKRINSIKIVSPVIGRIFGTAYVQVICAGIGNDPTEMSYLTLATSRDKVYDIIHQLIPELSLEDQLLEKIQHPPKNTIKIEAIREIVWIAVLFMGAFIAAMAKDIPEAYNKYVGLAICGFVVLQIIYRILKYRTGGWYVGENTGAFRSGVLTSTIMVFQYKKVEHMKIHKGPLENAFHLNRGDVFFKAELGNGVVEMCPIEEKNMELLLKKISFL